MRVLLQHYNNNSSSGSGTRTTEIFRNRFLQANVNVITGLQHSRGSNFLDSKHHSFYLIDSIILTIFLTQVILIAERKRMLQQHWLSSWLSLTSENWSVARILGEVNSRNCQDGVNWNKKKLVLSDTMLGLLRGKVSAGKKLCSHGDYTDS